MIKNPVFGRLPHDPRPPRLRLTADHLRGFTAPTTADWLSGVKSWPMSLNDQIGDCVTPETRVLTESLEWVAAGSLRAGDRLLGFDEESQLGADGRKRGRWFSKCVVEKADIVQRPCYELEFEDGTIVRSSSGHRWLTKSTVQGELGCQRWERTEDLTVGPSRQTKVYKPLETWETDKSWDAGYLAAAFDGEGHLEQTRRANRVAFNQTANPMLDQVELSLKELGYDYHHEVHSRNKLLRVDGTPRKEMHTLRIGNRRDFLHFMGSVRPRRLLQKYDITSLGRIPGETVALVRKTYIGEQDVVMLDTSTRTYFAEGLASHNCTAAGAGHFSQAINWYGQGKDAPVSDADVLAFYEAISGYQPGKPSTDVGATLQDALKQWHQVGIGGNKIVAYAQIKASDLATIRACIALFGGVYTGMNFPASAMDQFNKGQEWTVVSRSRIEGGHCIPIGAYDADSFTCVTWGQTQKLSIDFLRRYVDEFWAPIDLDWLSAQGVSPAAIDGATLNADYQALTGQPGPFPVITPTPAPAPTPTPTPGPVDADKALAAAFATWKTAKGL